MTDAPSLHAQADQVMLAYQAERAYAASPLWQRVHGKIEGAREDKTRQLQILEAAAHTLYSAAGAACLCSACKEKREAS